MALALALGSPHYGMGRRDGEAHKKPKKPKRATPPPSNASAEFDSDDGTSVRVPVYLKFQCVFSSLAPFSLHRSQRALMLRTFPSPDPRDACAAASSKVGSESVHDLLMQQWFHGNRHSTIEGHPEFDFSKDCADQQFAHQTLNLCVFKARARERESERKRVEQSETSA